MIIKQVVVDRGKRDDIDEEDVQESYFRYMEENPMAGVINEEDDLIEYDDDGNPIMPDKKVCLRIVSLHTAHEIFIYLLIYLLTLLELDNMSD